MTQLPTEDEQPLLTVHHDEHSEDCEADRAADGAGDGQGNEDTTIVDERFNPPPPSPWKRLALLLFIGFLFYIAVNMRPSLSGKKPKVIYASRYSKDHKFRPAASPIITETLKDGRTRLRGAYPTTTTSAATPTQTARKKRRSARSGRASGKAKQKKGHTFARQ